MSASILQPEFFQRSTLIVAPALLGCFLTLDTPAQKISLMVTEVEAYDGPEDLASHARGGRRTARTETMFAPGGVWYAYLVYGLHWMLNIVTGPADYPAAVLIRGVAGLNGPGKVTKHFGLDGRWNGLPATCPNGLYFTQSSSSNIKHPMFDVIIAPRVGVDYAGSTWSRKPYRFRLQSRELDN